MAQSQDYDSKLWMQTAFIDVSSIGLSTGSPQPDVWPYIVSQLGGEEALSASARRHGAFQRARGIKSATDLLRLILSYAPGGRSLRVTSAQAAALEIADVSDVALLERFRLCPDWLLSLCTDLLADRALAVNGSFDQTVRIVDGSRIEGPGKTCWRLHLSYDPGRRRIADFALTNMDEGEKLDRVGIKSQEVQIADRGYPQPDGLRKTIEAGGSVLVRLTWNSLNLRDEAKRSLDWLRVLGQAARNGGVDMKVEVHKARGLFTPLPLRLIILPKPAGVADKARKTARNAARKNRRRIDPRTLESAGYMILITSLENTAFPAEVLAELYRVRWQIELAFKRLKSILHMDRLPAKDPGLAKSWIAAHLLLALLIEKTAAELAGFSP